MLCFQKQNTVSFRFSAPDLRFSFLHGTSYKKFASLSSLTSWKISSIPGGDAMQQTRSYREGGWLFAHGAALACTQTEEMMRERACLPEGKKAMQKVACFKLCSMESLRVHTSQQKRAPRIGLHKAHCLAGGYIYCLQSIKEGELAI